MSDPLLRDILRKLNYTFEETQDVQTRAEAYVNQVERLVTGRNRLGPNVRAVICLQLACKSAGLLLPYKSAVALSGISEAKYNVALKEISQILKLETKVTTSELVVQFGCSYLHEAVDKVYSEFVANCNQTSKTTKTSIDTNSSVAVAACFYATCLHYNVKIDKNKLLLAHITYPQEFKYLVELAQSVCNTLAPKSHTQNSAEKSKEVSQNKPTLASGPKKIQLVSPYAGYSMLPFQHLERTRSYQDYLNWKASILKEADQQSV